MKRAAQRIVRKLLTLLSDRAGEVDRSPWRVPYLFGFGIHHRARDAGWLRVKNL
jgi:hypothetical protein